MNKIGDSCNLVKQVLPIVIFAFVIVFAGVNYATNYTAKEEKISEEVGVLVSSIEAFEMPVKLVDESGNVIASSTGFDDELDYILNESFVKKFTTDTTQSKQHNAEQIIQNIFDGTYIKEMAANSNVSIDPKLLESIFGEEVQVASAEEVYTKVPQENIIIENDNSGEELIAIEDVQLEQEIETPAEIVESIAPLSSSEVPENYITYYDMKSTAYCLCKTCTNKTPGSSGYGVTASGLKIIPGTGMKVAAVDKSVIPLGTHIYVQGLHGAKDYGYATAADTGGAIKNMRIDLYFDTHSAALQWGIKDVRVYILPE